jgi:alpha-mannosidase
MQAANPTHSTKTVTLFLLSLISLIFAPGLRAADQPRPTLYYIPHTHWEGAVFKTREEYLDVGLINILKAVRMLQEYPDYRFALDQVAYFRPFLERYPEEAAAFRKFIAEGRLEIVGGMDVMPDVSKPGGESIVHQIQYAKNYCRKELGVDVKTAWLVDTFGHHPQMPQIYRLGGFDSFWFCRGVPKDEIPSEFLWEGIDGTRFPSIWIPGFYGLFYGPPRDLPSFSKWFIDRYNALNIHVHAPERVGLAGVDVSEPEDYVAPLIQQFNAKPASPFTIRYSVPSEFAAVVSHRSGLPVMTNDLSPIFQGTYSSRIELKQTTRELEYLLLTGEKLQSLASLFGHAPDPATLWRAWEPALFNQTHDLASGVMTDHVYDDTVRSYDFSRRVIHESIETCWSAIAAQIDTREPNGAASSAKRAQTVPLLVFNPLGWARSDAVEADVSLLDRGVTNLELLDSTGAPVPSEILSAKRDSHGGIEQARIIFVAHDVPALGWTTFHVRQAGGPAEPPKSDVSASAESTIANEFFELTFDRQTGAMTKLLDQAQQWDALSGPANIVSRQRDKGDLWELYHGLNGGSYIAMTNRQPVPTAAGEDLLTTGFSKDPGKIHRGAVFSEFQVAHPLGNSDFATRVRLYAGLKRVDIQTTLVNREKYVRYQVLFPTAVKDGRNVQEIPFGALERPNGVEFAAQNWVDCSDATHGVTLLNRGLPGNVLTDSTMMLSLLRSHNLGAYGFGGGYEPGMSSETGFELDQRRVLDYAVMPHAGNWRAAQSWRAGWEFNHPLLVHRAGVHAGSQPSRWGLLEVTDPNVVLTALSPADRGTMQLRVYEAAGKAMNSARVRLHAKIVEAREVNFLGDPVRKLKPVSDSLEFPLRPFEIKTLELRLGLPR